MSAVHRPLFIETTTFSNKDSAKTLSSVCMLVAQHHKDRKHFHIMDNTHGVLNAKFRLKFSSVQDILCQMYRS